MSRLALCLLGLALLPACATRNDYLLNRGGDLADILRLHFMAGPGVAVQGEVTRALSLGFTYEQDVYAAGLANREVGVWQESVVGWGLIMGRHDETVTAPIGPISGSYGWTFGREGSAFQMAEQSNALDLLTIRGTVMVLLGVDVEVRLGELIDFCGGLFLLDLANDDARYEGMRDSEGRRARDVPVPPPSNVRNPAKEGDYLEPAQPGQR